MKAEDLMTNNDSDLYRVSLIVNKNQGNCWSTETLEKARLSIKLFIKENPELNRSEARIYNACRNQVLEIIKL